MVKEKRQNPPPQFLFPFTFGEKPVAYSEKEETSPSFLMAVNRDVFLVGGSPLPDLNRRLFAYHANTLPAELRGQDGNRSRISASFYVTLRSTSSFFLHLFLLNTKSELILPGTRLELVTRGFSVLCSTN
jgi:hypothetical protein